MCIPQSLDNWNFYYCNSAVIEIWQCNRHYTTGESSVAWGSSEMLWDHFICGLVEAGRFTRLHPQMIVACSGLFCWLCVLEVWLMLRLILDHVEQEYRYQVWHTYTHIEAERWDQNSAQVLFSVLICSLVTLKFEDLRLMIQRTPWGNFVAHNSCRQQITQCAVKVLLHATSGWCFVATSCVE